jgi:hypothetical protein
LIALTYSFLAVQFIVLRVLYCQLWVDGQDFGWVGGKGLDSFGPRLRFFQLLAGMIPLVGAVVQLGVGPDLSGDLSFRLLGTALIVLGMVGFGLATVAHNILSQTLAVLNRAERMAPPEG